MDQRKPGKPVTPMPVVYWLIFNNWLSCHTHAQAHAYARIMFAVNFTDIKDLKHSLKYTIFFTVNPI